MEITIARLGPVVRELRRIHKTLEWLAALKEMEMHAAGTYRTETAEGKTIEKDAAEVSYTDQELEAAVASLEREGAHEWAEKLRESWKKEYGDG